MLVLCCGFASDCALVHFVIFLIDIQAQRGWLRLDELPDVADSRGSFVIFASLDRLILPGATDL